MLLCLCIDIKCAKFIIRYFSKLIKIISGLTRNYIRYIIYLSLKAFKSSLKHQYNLLLEKLLKKYKEICIIILILYGDIE